MDDLTSLTLGTWEDLHCNPVKIEWKPLTLSLADRGRHLYLVGQTGTGKTTLVRNLFLQDIAAGRGGIFVDPHGDEMERILDLIPPARRFDVIYFNPGDLEWPVGLNILSGVPPDARHLVVSSFLETCKSLWWPDADYPRLEYVLGHALMALLEIEGATLLGVPKLLTDASYRASVTKRISDPVVRAFWSVEYEGYGPKLQAEASAPVLNKLGRFLTAAPLRNVIGQSKNKLNFRSVLDEGKILLVNLSRIGPENANVLGSFVITSLTAAAHSRIDTPEEERPWVGCCVDEFQNFTTRSFAKGLSELRKFHLSFILSHQYTAQLDQPIIKAIFGNVGSIVAFRVGAEDAEFLERQFGHEVTADVLTELDNYHVIAKLLKNGTPSGPYRAVTEAPLGTPYGPDDRAVILSHSRTLYAQPRSVVEEKLTRFLGAPHAG